MAIGQMASKGLSISDEGILGTAIAIELSAAGPGIAVSKERVSVLSVSSTGPDLIVVFQVKLSL
jgi:hypothetical protein